MFQLAATESGSNKIYAVQHHVVVEPRTIESFVRNHREHFKIKQDTPFSIEQDNGNPKVYRIRIRRLDLLYNHQNFCRIIRDPNHQK